MESKQTVDPAPIGVEYKKEDYVKLPPDFVSLIFRTKDSRKTLNPEHVRELYAYIMGYIKTKSWFLYRINSMEDHLHLLSDLHPNLALANYMRDMKTSSSNWLKQSGKFPKFQGWAEGYAALTYAWRDKDTIVNYIKKQQEHHKNVTFEEELKSLLVEHGIEVDDSFFP
ncbi:MAG: transposase [Bacteroidales bacterium]|nr:transposase [Bacteroidales bacterium]MCF8456156.1 transposase [Bacteroidales bacterium]